MYRGVFFLFLLYSVAVWPGKTCSNTLQFDDGRHVAFAISTDSGRNLAFSPPFYHVNFHRKTGSITSSRFRKICHASSLRMDVGEGSRIQRQHSLFQKDAPSRSSRKPHADVNTDFPANVLKPAVYYNFSKLGFKLEHTVNNPSQSTMAFLGDTPQVDERAQEMDSVQSEIMQLKTELDKLKAEHRDINEVSLEMFF